MIHLGPWGGGSHGIHAEACNKKNLPMPFRDASSCPRQAEAPPRSLGAQPCQPFPSGQLVLSSLSGQIRAAVTTGWHTPPEGWWKCQAQPVPAQRGSTVRWVSAEDSTLTQPLRQSLHRRPVNSGGRTILLKFDPPHSVVCIATFVFDSTGHPFLSPHGASSLCHPQVFCVLMDSLPSPH